MAQMWLDVARYGDSDGYLNDSTGRLLHPYRDWVISAFSRNLPYNQFVAWQVAGDLLPKPTTEQLLATSFLRQGKRNNEGGIIDEEFRVEYVNERAGAHGQGVHGAHGGVRAMSRSQVRRDQPGGVLPARRLLQQHRRARHSSVVEPMARPWGRHCPAHPKADCGVGRGAQGDGKLPGWHSARRWARSGEVRSRACERSPNATSLPGQQFGRSQAGLGTASRPSAATWSDAASPSGAAHRLSTALHSGPHSRSPSLLKNINPPSTAPFAPLAFLQTSLVGALEAYYPSIAPMSPHSEPLMIEPSDGFSDLGISRRMSAAAADDEGKTAPLLGHLASEDRDNAVQAAFQEGLLVLELDRNHASTTARRARRRSGFAGRRAASETRRPARSTSHADRRGEEAERPCSTTASDLPRKDVGPLRTYPGVQSRLLG